MDNQGGKGEGTKSGTAEKQHKRTKITKEKETNAHNLFYSMGL